MSQTAVKRSSHVLDMTNGNIYKLMIAFTLPIFLSQVFQQLYNTADAFIVGKFLGTDAFAGCAALTDVYYNGSEAQWQEVWVDGGNELLLEANRHYGVTSAQPNGDNAQNGSANSGNDNSDKDDDKDDNTEGGNSLLWIAIAAVVVIGGGAAVFFILRKKKEQN